MSWSDLNTPVFSTNSPFCHFINPSPFYSTPTLHNNSTRTNHVNTSHIAPYTCYNLPSTHSQIEVEDFLPLSSSIWYKWTKLGGFANWMWYPIVLWYNALSIVVLRSGKEIVDGWRWRMVDWKRCGGDGDDDDEWWWPSHKITFEMLILMILNWLVLMRLNLSLPNIATFVGIMTTMWSDWAE